jgi:hypothetical protein
LFSVFAALLFVHPAARSAPVCSLAEVESQWIQKALDGWHEMSESLHLENAPLPWMVLFDNSCVWHLMPGDGVPVETVPIATSLSFAGAAIPVRAKPHGGTIRLPRGDDIPADPIAYASMYGEGSATFFVMALPEVWLLDPQYARDPTLVRYMLGVLIHEMVHTQQLPALVEQMQKVADRNNLPDLHLDDDIIQHRFESVPGFTKAFEAERDVLFQAASEADLSKRHALTARGLSMIRQRRARYFKGVDQMYAEFEELFLSMEGAAQWAAYRYAKAHADPTASDAATVDFIRDNRKAWSQEEGLALFLLLDAWVPDWQAKIFASPPALPTSLLADALRPHRK